MEKHHAESDGSLMETNVYSLKGDVMVAGACLQSVWTDAFDKLAATMDQVYTLCLETTHINMAITKLSAALGTGQVTKLIFASVDRSPHCTQMHYIKHEIERTLKEHVPINSFVVSEGEIIPVPDEAVEMSKTLAKLSVQMTRVSE